MCFNKAEAIATKQWVATLVINYNNLNVAQTGSCLMLINFLPKIILINNKFL